MSGILQYAVMHPFSAEIYRIIEGRGTLVTGELTTYMEFRVTITIAPVRYQ